MIVRSVSLGFDHEGHCANKFAHEINDFFSFSDSAFFDKGVSVRTKRLIFPPFYLNKSSYNVSAVVSWFSSFCKDNGINWFCVPFDTFGQDMNEVNSISLEIMKRNKNAFVNYIISDNMEINMDAILYGSKLIKNISRLSSNGYDNFRFGASFGCRHNSPFFPFTYHEGKNGFSLAVEPVSIFIKTIEENRNSDIKVLREILCEKLGAFLKEIDDVGKMIEEGTDMVYYGIDSSLSPYPDSHDNSVANLISSLNIDSFGSSGTLFLVSFLTDILKDTIRREQIRHVGFNGVMLSLLEDSKMGIENKFHDFTIDSLLLYSTVCGCGLDMVPVPGDIFEEEIASILMDTASISSTLRKPLGARILPIPQKHAGEFTEFGYNFLHNTRIKKCRNRGMAGGHFLNNSTFSYLRKT